MSKSSMLFIILAIGIVLVLFLYSISGKTRSLSTLDAFAVCTKDQGSVMWGAWWCPHCQSQKESFGESFENVQYVECSPAGSRVSSQQCTDAGITGFPTWRFADGSELTGVQPLEVLAAKTGCSLPADAVSL